MNSKQELEAALMLLGEVLAERGHPSEVAGVGGAALLLLDLIDRPTPDLDILMRLDGGRRVRGKPLPAPRDVRDD